MLLIAAASAQNSQPPASHNSVRPKPKPSPGKTVSTENRRTPSKKKEQSTKTGALQKPDAKGKTSPAKISGPAKKPQAGRQKTTANSTTKAASPRSPGEAEEYSKALSLQDRSEKIAALRTFLEKFPASKKKTDVLELIAVTRISLAQDKLTAAEFESGIDLLKTAIGELPTPISEKLYNESISRIPADLFNNGQRLAARETASLIESKIGDNAPQLLNLAGFFLMTENGTDAKRLAEKAIAIVPTSAAYQSLGLADRLNFQLEDASQTYAKALELEPDSMVTLRNLADLKRAQAKPDEAADLYRQILAKDATSLPAETGLILALFDGGKKTDAEQEMARSLDQNPNNVILLAGAAYWYSAHNEPDKAIEYAQDAIAKEPRYIWSHIALAHGYLAKHQPAIAEQILLKARVYGNFPTLEYEIASARLMSGFYADAIDELKKSFSVKDGIIHTKLGGRIDTKENGFIETLANERRASIFEPEAADDTTTADKLKALLEFDNAVNAPAPAEDAAAKAADAFTAGDDAMKLHRQLFAASTLLSKRIALSKVSELADAAIGNTDAALNVADPGAAVMASELYESRALALTRGELIKVPDVPRAMLSAILRGRIEEIAGWSLFNQNKPSEAVIRLRRAVSVMPEKSAWWRSSMWRLGSALQADNKEAEALDSYIKSYSIDMPEGARYAVIESLYRKLNGNLDGLEGKIGKNPMPLVVNPTPDADAVARSIEPKASVSPTPDEISTVRNVVTSPASVEPLPSPTLSSVEATPTPSTEPTPSPTASPTPSIQPTPSPEASPTPSIEPTPSPEASPAVEPSPVATPEAKVSPSPEQRIGPEPQSSPTPEKAVTGTTPETAKPEASPTPDAASNEPRSSNTAGQLDKPVGSQPADSTVARNSGKQIFDPVIITIPNREIAKRSGSAGEKKPVPVEKLAEKGQPKVPASDDMPTEDQKDGSGQIRSRIVAEKDPSRVPHCSISVSQDLISIINNGGSLGILVRMDEGDLKTLKPLSSNPDDVQITLEPEIAGVKGQAFYVIHSLTAKTGDFTVSFIAPCGRKEITVNVR